MPRVKLFDEDLVLEKAMTIFWRNGYNATSMQQLVNGLGISRASLYDTFGSKEALFERSLALYRNMYQKKQADFLNQHSNIKQGFLALFEMAIDGSINDDDSKGCFVVNTTTELIPDGKQLLPALCQNKTALEKTFYKYLERGTAAGQIAKGHDLKAIAAMLFTLYSGLQVITKINSEKRDIMASMQVALAVLD